MGKKRGLQNKEKLPLKLLMVSFVGYSKHSSLLQSYFETSIAIFFFAREKKASPFFGEHSSPAISLADFSGGFDGELFACAYSYFI
jgi:hypothetical protein